MQTTILKPYFRDLEAIKRDLPKQARKILIDNRDEILRILKDKQLGQGLTPSGGIIGKYSKTTEQRANELFGKPRKPKVAGQPYNLEWTGGFFDEMYMFFEDMKSYSIFSEDGKAELLKSKFGDITTMSDKHNEIVNRDILIPKLIEWAMSKIQV